MNASSSSSSTPDHRPTAVGAPVELAKAYKPADHEKAVWDLWLKANAFAADPKNVKANGGTKDPYAIIIPPPNVTAALHLGHALNNTLQDILARMHRMKGYETLWMPGTDHAGIATQAVVEKRVMKEEKKRKTDFTREQFVAKIQAFKDEYEAVITGQLKAMGCSCDWDRQRFTMDEQCATAVREAFFILFRDGLIYRGKRLVNWDPALQTAVADDECYDEEVDGQFYFLKYPLVDSDETITVATTRPETYLGDTAVAMNPRDPRAKQLVGKKVRLPLVGREIPIIADDYAVLPESMATTDEEKNDPKAKFSTGFVKMTPAHDTNDYEIGVRHGLAMVNMMSPDGRVSDKHGWDTAKMPQEFVGKKMEEARKLVVEEFTKLGLFEGAKPTRHSKKFSDRSKAVVEPYLSDQWYVRVTDPKMAETANAALVAEQRTGANAAAAKGASTDGELSFFPARYAKTYEQWHDNIRDWCISRQLWWGHRIPVWTKVVEGDATKLNNEHAMWSNLRSDASVVVRSFLNGQEVGKTQTLGSGTLVIHVCVDGRDTTSAVAAFEAAGFTQDPDVLDTWFSSALWPLSTMGWPNPRAFAGNEGLLEAFNPTSTLCTAREIITLWVSRMVMFNRYFRGTPGSVPFKHVYIHAVIQDGEGRKMSKSLGNGVDPLDIIETHGSDAMRFTLCHMATNTQDVRMPVQKDSKSGKNTSPKFDLGRNFANKLWNATRFALSMIPAGSTSSPRHPVTSSLPLLDRWMLSRLAAGVQSANASLADYQFSEYAMGCYTLLWNDFCDWYLEGIKPTVANSSQQQAVLAHTLESIVRLLHPVMPFVTETIFQNLRHIQTAPVAGITLTPPTKLGTLCTAGWPQVSASLRDEAAERDFARVQSLVALIRDIRAKHQVKPARKITLHVPASVSLAGVDDLIKTFANIETITQAGAQGTSVPFAFEGAELRVSSLIDPAEAAAAAAAGENPADAEKARLTKQIADLEKSIATLEGRLSNPGYADRAPPAMVQQTRDQLVKAKADRDAAAAALAKM
ncbi:MAG: valine--tRNA ligase [Phycisphaerae bacterium]|jgi:valyl-tRNA synthetase